ncbi:hypothetical protein GCM10009539_44990 [Cryptosporangium japonicum]|uniref:Secreted protein n=1 Tax=Cryptosporangium japonicum TaxID=80872 RepID=A0ABP3EAE3_9ACTN
MPAVGWVTTTFSAVKIFPPPTGTSLVGPSSVPAGVAPAVASADADAVAAALVAAAVDAVVVALSDPSSPYELQAASVAATPNAPAPATTLRRGTALFWLICPPSSESVWRTGSD